MKPMQQLVFEQNPPILARDLPIASASAEPKARIKYTPPAAARGAPKRSSFDPGTAESAVTAKGVGATPFSGACLAPSHDRPPTLPPDVLFRHMAESRSSQWQAIARQSNQALVVRDGRPIDRLAMLGRLEG